MVIANHQTARQYAQAAIHDAHVVIEDFRRNTGICENRLGKIQQDRVVGFQYSVHDIPLLELGGPAGVPSLRLDRSCSPFVNGDKGQGQKQGSK